MKYQKELRKQKRLKSLRKLNDSLTNDPTKIRSWLKLGEAYIHEKDYEEAMVCIETALTLGSLPVNGKLNAVRKSINNKNYNCAKDQLYSIKEICWQEFRKS